MKQRWVKFINTFLSGKYWKLLIDETTTETIAKQRRWEKVDSSAKHSKILRLTLPELSILT